MLLYGEITLKLMEKFCGLVHSLLIYYIVMLLTIRRKNKKNHFGHFETLVWCNCDVFECKVSLCHYRSILIIEFTDPTEVLSFGI